MPTVHVLKKRSLKQISLQIPQNWNVNIPSNGNSKKRSADENLSHTSTQKDKANDQLSKSSTGVINMGQPKQPTNNLCQNKQSSIIDLTLDSDDNGDDDDDFKLENSSTQLAKEASRNENKVGYVIGHVRQLSNTFFEQWPDHVQGCTGSITCGVTACAGTSHLVRKSNDLILIQLNGTKTEHLAFELCNPDYPNDDTGMHVWIEWETGKRQEIKKSEIVKRGLGPRMRQISI